MTKRSKMIETRSRVGYDGCYYLIVPDHAAGSPNRYTVYKIPASPNRRVRVVGRELPIGFAHRYVRRLVDGTWQKCSTCSKLTQTPEENP
jgi:hypothetical protein